MIDFTFITVGMLMIFFDGMASPRVSRWSVLGLAALIVGMA